MTSIVLVALDRVETILLTLHGLRRKLFLYQAIFETLSELILLKDLSQARLQILHSSAASNAAFAV